MTGTTGTRSFPPKGSISARDLVKTFNRGSTRALDHLDFDAAPGEMTAVTGPSGSGKSTLLYALAGLIDLESGSVSVSGETPRTHAEWTWMRQRHIGLIFQDDWLLPTLTCAQNVELPMIGLEHSQKRRRERVGELLKRVNASDLADRIPAGLSGGERQRVAIARSLVNRPEILLADEPTGELDSGNSQIVMDLLTTLSNRERMTIVIVTHDPKVARACGRHFVLCDGKGTYTDLSSETEAS